MKFPTLFLITLTCFISTVQSMDISFDKDDLFLDSLIDPATSFDRILGDSDNIINYAPSPDKTEMLSPYQGQAPWEKLFFESAPFAGEDAFEIEQPAPDSPVNKKRKHATITAAAKLTDSTKKRKESEEITVLQDAKKATIMPMVPLIPFKKAKIKFIMPRGGQLDTCDENPFTMYTSNGEWYGVCPTGECSKPRRAPDKIKLKNMMRRHLRTRIHGMSDEDICKLIPFQKIHKKK